MRRPAGRSRFIARALGLPQALRLAGCALAIGWLRLTRPPGAPRDHAEALRLAHTLGALKGAFAKVGQFASLRLDALPAEVREGLSGLRNRVPPLPLSTIRGVIEAELGGRLEDHFARFDASPLGAASIAQVHRARLHGEGPDAEVVVKVQYPWLAASLSADLGLLRWMSRWAGGSAAARATRARLFDEFSAGVREELDFEREAQVAAEIAENLAADPQLLVPRVVPSHSTRAVLTVVHHPTHALDGPALEAEGVSPAAVLEVIARAYAQQVFVDGLFHADPHPGNLFVLDEPEKTSRPRVLFVDFGLSKRLDPALRIEMRQAIYALLQWDVDAFVAGMQRLDMVAPGAEPGVRAAVAAMFERLRGEQGGPLAMGPARVLAMKDEAKQLLDETPGLRLPNDLLLYAKTLSYLFGLGAELAPDVDLVKLTVPYLLRFLAGRESSGPAATSAREAAGPGGG